MTARGHFDTDRLETALARAGLSLDQLADRTGLDTRTLERIRAGKTKWPHPQTVATIARALAIADAGELWTWPGRLPAAAPGGAGAAGAAWTVSPAPRPDHPFDPWVPAVPPAFVGRLDLLRTLERAAHEGLGLSLVGEPRIGKTSLLSTWRLAASGLGLKVCLISGQGPEGAGERALVARILADGRPDPERAAAAALDAVPETADGAADRLADWCTEPPAPGQPGGQAGSRARPILLIDEAETLLCRCRPRFLERLRGLLTGRRLSLALVTRRTLDAVYQDLGRTSPFPNLLGLERVGLLDADAARALIARGQDRWAPDDADRLLEWAGAHPFYLTLLARRLYDARGLGEAREHALERFRAEAECQIALWWAALAGRDRATLQGAARGEPVDDFRLRQRGLLRDDHRPFAKVFETWLNERS